LGNCMARHHAAQSESNFPCIVLKVYILMWFFSVVHTCFFFFKIADLWLKKDVCAFMVKEYSSGIDTIRRDIQNKKKIVQFSFRMNFLDCNTHFASS
jgi:hypothetical protein